MNKPDVNFESGSLSSSHTYTAGRFSSEEAAAALSVDNQRGAANTSSGDFREGSREATAVKTQKEEAASDRQPGRVSTSPVRDSSTTAGAEKFLPADPVRIVGDDGREIACAPQAKGQTDGARDSVVVLSDTSRDSSWMKLSGEEQYQLKKADAIIEMGLLTRDDFSNEERDSLEDIEKAIARGNVGQMKDVLRGKYYDPESLSQVAEALQEDMARFGISAGYEVKNDVGFLTLKGENEPTLILRTDGLSGTSSPSRESLLHPEEAMNQISSQFMRYFEMPK